MSVTSKFYGKAFLSAFNKEIDWDSDVIKVALLTSAYTPNQDTHQYYADLSGEVSSSGTGYTTGGATLGSPSMSYTGATNVFAITGNAVTWNNVTFTARYAVVYDSTPATNKPLICLIDFAENKSPSAGNFSITWDAAGIAKVTVD